MNDSNPSISSKPILLFWLCVLVSYLPVMGRHVANMWRIEEYHYLPALAVLLVIVFVRDWNRQLQWPGRWEIGYLVAAVGILAVSYLLDSPWVGAVSFGLTVFAFYQSQCDDDGQPLGFVWPLLLLIVPLPLGLDSTLANGLQRGSTLFASRLLDWAEVPHARIGNVMELRDGDLFVEEACSGVQSLFTVLFCALAILVLFRRPSILLPVYLLAGAFAAGVLNVVRLATIAYASHHRLGDLSHGFAHELLGYACLLMAVGLLLSFDRLFRVLFFPTNPERYAERIVNPLTRWWNEWMGPRDTYRRSPTSLIRQPVVVTLGALFGILLVLHGAAFARHVWTQPVDGEPYREAFVELDPTLEIKGFEAGSHEIVMGTMDQPFGQHSDVWQGESQSMPVYLAVSQPYPRWHDLCVCYEVTGWEQNEREIVVEDDWSYVQASFVDPAGKRGYLWFTAMNERGENVVPADLDIFSRLRYHIWDRDKRVATESSGKVALAQVFSSSSSNLTSEEQYQLRNLLAELSKRLREQIQGTVPAGSVTPVQDN